MTDVLADSKTGNWPRSSQELARSIFKADLPEQYIRSIPAQSLYCVVQHNGLESSADLIEIATIEQCRLLIDFDLWHKDQLNEANLWIWLALTDATQDLDLLQKIVSCLDLKIVALIVGRYVNILTFEEPTDLPPEPKYYTPDKGRTWIAINNLDSDKEFLLNRLLALLFESNADLFYQLIAIPSLNTSSILEEESYQDKVKRLAAEGIPDKELAHSVNAPFYIGDLQQSAKTIPHNISNDLSAIQPLIYDSSLLDPLQRLFQAISNRAECEAELSFILNCAIVHWDIDFSDQKAVQSLVNKVKGAVCIGIELLELQTGDSIAKHYQELTLQKIYRLGLTKLIELRKKALKLSDEQLRYLADNNRGLFQKVATLREPFPCLPDESDSTNMLAISSLQQLEELASCI